MDIEHAQAIVAARPEAVSKIRARLADHHAMEPQRAALADLHLKAIEEALAQLAGLGHRFVISELERDAAVPFPAMLYRDSSDGRTLLERLVHDPAELQAARDEGWREHPQAQRPTDIGTHAGEQTDDAHASKPPDGAAGIGATTGEHDLVSHTTEEQAEVLHQADEAVQPAAEPVIEQH